MTMKYNKDQQLDKATKAVTTFSEWFIALESVELNHLYPSIDAPLKQNFDSEEYNKQAEQANNLYKTLLKQASGLYDDEPSQETKQNLLMLRIIPYIDDNGHRLPDDQQFNISDSDLYLWGYIDHL